MLLLVWVWVLQLAAATKKLQLLLLLTCMDNSQVLALLFDVKFYPKNNLVELNIMAISNINANVSANVQLIAYGLQVVEQNIDLCSFPEFKTLCPLTSGHLDVNFNYTLSLKITRQIPGVAYTVPDLDARVRIVVYDTKTKENLACVEAVVSNGKTVQTKYAAWPIAAISGLGVVTSGVISVVGHLATAAHIALNSMSLFVYFQLLAITLMLAVAKVPPIAAAWAENFVWLCGIVQAGFIQKIANWYLQATGGSPTDVLHNLYLSISVQKMKRGLQYAANQALFKRVSVAMDSSNISSDSLNSTLYTTDEKNVGSKVLVLRGMQRVAYLANIEITNLYMTSTMFLVFFAFVVVACTTFFKAAIEICIRLKFMNEGKFSEYRQQWGNIIKGALYRLLLIALPQISVMSLWEFTRHDLGGIVVVAVFLLCMAVALLGYACVRVVALGRRLVRDHKNAAYHLYSDGPFLNKFGFVYVQFRADCYYFVLINLVYIFLKSLIVAVLQLHGKVQAVIVFVIELVYCVVLCWIRPYMDKRTNAFNITISVISTINALFFMFFSYVFHQPQVVASVMAIVYFVLNAVFALFLLLFTIITCALALVHKNPDTRYQPMRDDRVSFLPRIQNGKHASTHQDDLELVALGASAMKGHEHGKSLVYDEDSLYDDDSSPANTKNGSYQYGETESLLKLSAGEPLEAQEPSSTIVGNSNSAYGYQTAYTGLNYSSNYTTPASPQNARPTRDADPYSYGLLPYSGYYQRHS